MCGIAGVSASPCFMATRSLHAENLFRWLLFYQKDRGKHSSGIVYVGDEGFEINKGIAPCDISQNFVTMQSGDTAVFGHARYATVGDKTNVLNVHPFETDKYVGIHNGTLFNHKILRDRLGIKTRGQCDSEVLYKVLDIYGIDGIGMLEGTFALSFIDKAKPNTILVITNGSRPMHFIRITGARLVAFLSSDEIFEKEGVEDSLARHLGAVGAKDYEIVGADPGVLYSITKGALKIERKLDIICFNDEPSFAVTKFIYKGKFAEHYAMAVPVCRRLTSGTAPTSTSEKSYSRSDIPVIFPKSTDATNTVGPVNMHAVNSLINCLGSLTTAALTGDMQEECDIDITSLCSARVCYKQSEMGRAASLYPRSIVSSISVTQHNEIDLIPFLYSMDMLLLLNTLCRKVNIASTGYTSVLVGVEQAEVVSSLFCDNATSIATSDKVYELVKKHMRLGDRIAPCYSGVSSVKGIRRIMHENLYLGPHYVNDIVGHNAYASTIRNCANNKEILYAARLPFAIAFISCALEYMVCYNSNLRRISTTAAGYSRIFTFVGDHFRKGSPTKACGSMTNRELADFVAAFILDVLVLLQSKETPNLKTSSITNPEEIMAAAYEETLATIVPQPLSGGLRLADLCYISNKSRTKDPNDLLYSTGIENREPDVVFERMVSRMSAIRDKLTSFTL